MAEQSEPKDAPAFEATADEATAVTDKVGEGELTGCIDFDAVHRAAKADEAKAKSAKPATDK